MNALNVRENGIYVDATFGRGGHSRRILEQLGSSGQLIAIDLDPEAIEAGRTMFGGDPRVSFVQRNFGELDSFGREFDLEGRVDGLLLDVGVSSPQLDDPERGFSFRADGPLDMRMNPDVGQPASAWLADVSEPDLVDILFRYGEERQARRIARAIVRARETAPIERTAQLAGIVAEAVPGAAARERIHPATRTFQAIRIVVNGELDALAHAMDAAIGLLAPGGRLAVISFHSLEDRIVKQSIRRHSEAPPVSRRMPLPPDFQPRLRRVGKLIRADAEEQHANPRSRSARLRVAERTDHEGGP